ncbi:MAG: DUF5329 domain-containing protein [Halieaceae bacterium]|nr:DUF5329 domain-containing protein [Halieaceae bacterium]
MTQRLLQALAAVLLITSLMPARATTTPGEVDYLLQYVADSGCTFIRNGNEYDAPRAAAHLTLKYQRGKQHVESAEQFINRLASASSWTQTPYRVRCGRDEETSQVWLQRALSDYRVNRHCAGQSMLEGSDTTCVNMQ